MLKRITNWLNRHLWNLKNKNFKVRKCNNSHLLKIKFKVGRSTKGVANVFLYGDEREEIVIGEFCSIAESTFISSGRHLYSSLSTGIMNYERQRKEASKGPIIIDDDVWIGYGCIILSGCHIGQGAIIAAGSVVTKNVEPYSIVGGVPAKTIKYRFNKDIIEELMNVDFKKLSEIGYKNNKYVFEDIDEHSISTILKNLPLKNENRG